VSERVDPESLIEFPCHYQFKAVGVADGVFKNAVVEAISRHIPVVDDAVHCKASGKGKYLSVSVMVTLHNFKQLKEIYAALRQIQGMKMLL